MLYGERLYHIVAINEKSGTRTILTAYPDTHDACCTMMKKLTPYPTVRIQLEEVGRKIVNDAGEHTATFHGQDDEGFGHFTLNFTL